MTETWSFTVNKIAGIKEFWDEERQTLYMNKIALTADKEIDWGVRDRIK